LRKEKHGPAVVAIAGGRGKGGIAIWNPKGDNKCKKHDLNQRCSTLLKFATLATGSLIVATSTKS
jgi:hypothetical protein